MKIAKINVYNRIYDSGVVAVIRAESAEQALKVSRAVVDGGIAAVEITMTVPGALEAIAEVKSCFGAEILLGAGTVIDQETARLAILAGAAFVVSPHLDAGVVRLCNRYGVACLPGAATVRDVVEAMELGADIVKIFPGSLFGPEIIKAFKGPLPQANLLPTGGVSLDNVEQWIRAGSYAVGVGGELTRDGLKAGDFSLITRTAAAFVEKIRLARTPV